LAAMASGVPRNILWKGFLQNMNNVTCEKGRAVAKLITRATGGSKPQSALEYATDNGR